MNRHPGIAQPTHPNGRGSVALCLECQMMLGLLLIPIPKLFVPILDDPNDG